MFSQGTSHYFFKKDDKRFGSQQADYLIKVSEIVAKTADKICHAVKEKTDLKSLFHEVINSFGDDRHRIAIEHGTKDAKKFGIKRINSSSQGMLHTPLSESYAEYNETLLTRIQQHLRSIKHDFKTYQQTELKIPGNLCMGRRTSLDISILCSEKQADWTLDFSRSTYERICGICSISQLDDSHCIGACFNHLMNNDVLRTIKEKSVEDYKKLKLMHLLKDIYKKFPGKKSDWVLVTPHCEIQGKMYALTSYLTWMYRTYNDDPVEYMTERADKTIVTLCHQDKFLIPDTMNEIADLFKQAIEWKGDDVQELLNLVGLINYLFAHATPFDRGSAAICEWLEMSIYRYHKFDLQYNIKLSVNMEALTLPLDEFIKKYSSMIQLEPINESSLKPREF